MITEKILVAEAFSKIMTNRDAPFDQDNILSKEREIPSIIERICARVIHAIWPFIETEIVEIKEISWLEGYEAGKSLDSSRS